MTENAADFMPLVREAAAGSERHFGFVFTSHRSLATGARDDRRLRRTPRRFLREHEADEALADQIHWLGGGGGRVGGGGEGEGKERQGSGGGRGGGRGRRRGGDEKIVGGEQGRGKGGGGGGRGGAGGGGGGGGGGSWLRRLTDLGGGGGGGGVERGGGGGLGSSCGGRGAPKGWRIVIISQVLPIVEPLVPYLRELGHEPVAWLMARRSEQDKRPLPPWGDIDDSKVPAGLSFLLAPDKHAVEPLLRGLEPDLVLCAGFPWKLPQAALDVARLGSINEHPALLPRHRGPIPLAWAMREGDGQFGADLALHGLRARHRADPRPDVRAHPGRVDDDRGDGRRT